MNIRDIFPSYLVLRRVCRYQRGNENPSIEEGQTTQSMAKRKRTNGQTTIYKTNT